MVRADAYLAVGPDSIPVVSKRLDRFQVNFQICIFNFSINNIRYIVYQISEEGGLEDCQNTLGLLSLDY